MENYGIPATTQDALIPSQMALKAEQTGVLKANLDFLTTFMLAILAGGFIALGAIFATTVTAGSSDFLSFGISRLLGGLVFCIGLVLVVVAGAELFTGNNLIVMAWASRKVSTGKLLRNWGIVYAGNLAGSLVTAVLIALSGQYLFGDGAVGVNALNIANAKIQLGFTQALILGILCNVLVCLAVWLTLSARSVTDKIMAIIFPITAFVAAGFEHSVANMYFVPLGLLLKQEDAVVAAANLDGGELANLTVVDFLTRNLVPVTVGNVIGGAVLVGAVYWFVYLRPRGA